MQHFITFFNSSSLTILKSLYRSFAITILARIVRCYNALTIYQDQVVALLGKLGELLEDLSEARFNGWCCRG